jgi:hypothetical protein
MKIQKNILAQFLCIAAIIGRRADAGYLADLAVRDNDHIPLSTELLRHQLDAKTVAGMSRF